MPTKTSVVATLAADQQGIGRELEKTRRQVLIVDDSQTERLLLRETLLRDDDHLYVISEAESVSEAITRMHEQTPDCILLDYVLPGQNGLELLEHVHHTLADSPIAVILITAHGDESVAVAAMKGGAMDYLTKKELKHDALLRAVDNALEKVGMRRELILRRRQLEARNRELQEARQRLEQQNEQLLANQRALLNMMADLEAEIQRRQRAEQVK